MPSAFSSCRGRGGVSWEREEGAGGEGYFEPFGVVAVFGRHDGCGAGFMIGMGWGWRVPFTKGGFGGLCK